MSTTGSGASRAHGDGIHNEDSFLVEEGLGLYAVCDGASGSPAGEVAARIVTRELERFVASERSTSGGSTGLAVRDFVERAMRHALAALQAAERDDSALHGFATTVTMLLVHRDQGVVGHRGDSRAYLIRSDRAIQLTVDHELTEGASKGGEDEGDFDVFALKLEPRDTIVLCTDGAEEVVEEEAIVSVAGDVPPRVLASRIVSAANRISPEQDATAVVVRIRGEREPRRFDYVIPVRETAFGRTLELA